MTTGPTVAEALRAGIERLKANGITNAPRDAQLLLAYATGLAVDRITLHLQDVMTPDAADRYDAALAARCRHQPVSQITGQRQFWGMTFTVSPDVLDPRPETELLVATALQRPFLRMLDLGTGSGCILLSCLASQPLATGLGTDISAAALKIASQNADRLGLASRSRFQQADWCKGVEGRFDLIVSNPPYIAASEMADLSPDVRDWEPHLALTPGGDGLDAYRRIATQAPARLLPLGRLMVEIGPTQSAAVTALLAAQGLENLTTLQDLDGRDRLVMATKPLSA